jgi:hypothetical protein
MTNYSGKSVLVAAVFAISVAFNVFQVNQA